MLAVPMMRSAAAFPAANSGVSDCHRVTAQLEKENKQRIALSMTSISTCLSPPTARENVFGAALPTSPGDG